MKSELSITPKGETLTILEGKALEQQHPVKIRLSGNIESISNFLKKRYAGREGKELQAVDKDLACVIVNKDQMKIALLLDPQNPFGTEIEGQLLFTEELKSFHINDNTEFTREQLIKLLKFSKRLFADAQKHEEVLNSYMKLNLSGSTEIKSESDSRGNKDLAFKKTIQSQGIPKEFILDMPIFKGQQSERFRVEICLDVTDASVRFWLESVELVDIVDKRKNEIFDAQLTSCDDFVIIHK